MSTPLVEQKPFNGHTQGRLVFERHDHHASKYVGNLTVHMGSGSIRTVTCQLDYGSAEENEANAVFLAHCWNTYYQREAELQSMRDRLSRMEEAGSRMKILHMDHRDQEDASLFTDVMDAIDQWNAALSNK